MPLPVKDFTLPLHIAMKKPLGHHLRLWLLLILCSILPWAPPLLANPQQPVIVIDAGHGGNDTGASGGGDYHEKQFTLSLARQIAEKLGAKYRVSLTRTTDVLLSPANRAAVANHLAADLMVSIHAATTPYCGQRNAFLYYHDEDRLSFPPQMSASTIIIDPNGESTPWQRLQARHLHQSQAAAKAMKRSLTDGGSFDRVMVTGLPLVTLMGVDLPAVMVEVGCLHPMTAPSSRTLKRQLDTYAQSIATAIEAALCKVAGSTEPTGR